MYFCSTPPCFPFNLKSSLQLSQKEYKRLKSKNEFLLRLGSFLSCCCCCLYTSHETPTPGNRWGKLSRRVLMCATARSSSSSNVWVLFPHPSKTHPPTCHPHPIDLRTAFDALGCICFRPLHRLRNSFPLAFEWMRTCQTFVTPTSTDQTIAKVPPPLPFLSVENSLERKHDAVH